MACSCNLLKPALPLSSSNPSNFLGLCQHARQKALHVLGTRQVLRSCLARTKKHAKQHPLLFLCIYLSNSIYPDTYHTMICTHMYIIYIYILVYIYISVCVCDILPASIPKKSHLPRHRMFFLQEVPDILREQGLLGAQPAEKLVVAARPWRGGWGGCVMAEKSLPIGPMDIYGGLKVVKHETRYIWYMLI